MDMLRVVEPLPQQVPKLPLRLMSPVVSQGHGKKYSLYKAIKQQASGGFSTKCRAQHLVIRFEDTSVTIPADTRPVGSLIVRSVLVQLIKNLGDVCCSKATDHGGSTISDN